MSPQVSGHYRAVIAARHQRLPFSLQGLLTGAKRVFKAMFLHNFLLKGTWTLRTVSYTKRKNTYTSKPSDETYIVTKLSETEDTLDIIF